jgi:hypothetical protein
LASKSQKPASKRDETVALDGRPFKEIPSFDMAKLLSKNGAEYSLTLTRAGKELVVGIRLRRLLWQPQPQGQRPHLRIFL